MPKINIREFDLTKPGTPGAYRNFSVVVPGYVANINSVDTTMLDDNGICEFTKLAQFKQFANNNYQTVQNYHVNDTLVYVGNQITYELLSMGYTVIYKAFTKFASTNNQSTENSNTPTDTTTDFSNAPWYDIPLDDDYWWEPLKDKAAYDFRYIIPSLLYTNGISSGASWNFDTIINQAVKLAIHKEMEHTIEAADEDLFTAGRGDCFALLDIPEDTYLDKKTPKAIMRAAKQAISSHFQNAATRYAAIFTPMVTYSGLDSKEYFNNNLSLPASFHYLACAKRAVDTFSEWYAIAGYTRGVCSYVVESTSVKIGDYLVNELQPRYQGKAEGGNGDAKPASAVNVVAYQRGTYVLWGNRTAEAMDSKYDSLTAKHFLNIRQLCTTLKKQIYVTCRRLTFDPNSDTLWINFTSGIRPLLEKMKTDQGIKDYKIMQLPTQRKATLKALIRIIPIEAVEDFDIAISLEDSINGEVELYG